MIKKKCECLHAHYTLMYACIHKGTHKYTYTKEKKNNCPSINTNMITLIYASLLQCKFIEKLQTVLF